MTRPVSPVRWDALPLEKVTEMVARKTVRGVNLTLSQSYLKKGALVPRHAHAGEQMIYVLQGALRADLDGRPVMVREGELLHVPAGAPHQAEALDDTFVLDVTVEPAGTAGSPGPGEEAP
jgi:quercetin dioxygenase-like cupin family protein